LTGRGGRGTTCKDEAPLCAPTPRCGPDRSGCVREPVGTLRAVGLPRCGHALHV